MKQCRTCQTSKSREEFFLCARAKDGLQSSCKGCAAKYAIKYRRDNLEKVKAGIKRWAAQNSERVKEGHCNYYKKNAAKVLERGRQWRKNNPEKMAAAARRQYNPEKAAAFHRLRKYGMTIEQWDEMMLSQGGMCAMCNCEARLGVDHNHATGKVRALLCFGCNVALGHLKESITLATNAATYLKKYL